MHKAFIPLVAGTLCGAGYWAIDHLGSVLLGLPTDKIFITDTMNNLPLPVQGAVMLGIGVACWELVRELLIKK